MANSQNSSKIFSGAPLKTYGTIYSYQKLTNDFMPELQLQDGLAEYKKMSWNDPVAGGILLRLRAMLGSIKWKFDSDVMSMKQIRRLITEMTSSFTYGFYVGEILYGIDEKGQVMLLDVEPRAQTSIQNILDGVVYQWNVTGQIPIGKCLHFTILDDNRWKFGRSLLRQAYKPYYYKKAIEATEAVGIDRDLAGLPILQAPEDFDFTAANPDSPNHNELAETTMDWAKDVVSGIRRDEQEGVVLPFGWNLSLLRGEKSGFDTDKVIKRYNTEICVGLLEDFVAEGSFSASTRGTSELSIEIFKDSCESWAKEFEDAINEQVIQRVCEYNGVKDVPKLGHAPINSSNITDLASFVARLVSQGVIDPTPQLQNGLLDIAKLPEMKGGQNA